MPAEDARDVAVATRHRPLPSVGMPLLREERRASRTKRWVVLAVAGGAAVVLLGLGLAFHAEIGRAWGSVGAWLARPPAPRASKVVPFGVPTAEVATSPAPYTPPDLAALVGEPAEPPPPSPAGAPAAAPDAPDAPEGQAAAPSRTVEGDGTVRVRRPFGQARFFREALAQAGLDAAECEALEAALGGVMDFRRCRPHDELVLVRDSSGHLVRFEYHPGLTHYYRARRAGDSFSGERVDVPVETRKLAKGGVVRSSLGEALVGAGLGRTLVGVFVEAFQGKANFARDTREGDVFRILVDERRVRGESLGYGTIHAVEYAGSRTGRLRAYWFEPREGDGDFYDPSGRSTHGSWLRTPLRYERISSRFDPRRLHPILKRVVPHNGVDYAAGTGTPVWSGADGRVTWSGPKGPNGNMVAVRHDGGFESFYCHLSRIERGIAVGTQVSSRQVIGYVGSTGRSTGPHLHFGLKRGGRWVDPLAVIEGPGRLLPPGQRRVFLARAAALGRELDAIDAGAPLPAQGRGEAEGDAARDEDEAMD